MVLPQKKVKKMNNPRYVLVPDDVHTRVFETPEEAQREIEVRFIEDSTKKYILAEIVATCSTKLEFTFLKKVKQKRGRKPKLAIITTPILAEADSFVHTQTTVSELGNVSTLPPELSIIPNPLEFLTNPRTEVVDATMRAKSKVMKTTTPGHCIFDNVLTFKFVEENGVRRYLCEEHC